MVFDVLLPALAWAGLIALIALLLFRRWESRYAAGQALRLRFPVSPMAYLSRRLVVESLVTDPVIQTAIGEKAEQDGLDHNALEKQVRRYANEIVPAFKAIFYFLIGYRIARLLLFALYRVKMVRSAPEEYAKIGHDATAVLFMNHRSNADVLVVNYLLSRHSAVSHAAGEWARLWPLNHLVRMAGNYVVDRDSNDPLYRLVLKRFVQMAVTHGIHLGIFPEGGLTRDGRIQPLSFGLLNYVATATWPGHDRDILFIPVSFNYDQVAEQTNLVFGSSREFRERGKIYVAWSSLVFCLKMLAFPFTPRSKRFGWACASFGDPVSLKSWQRARGIDLKTLNKEERREHIGKLGRQLADAVSDMIPVLPIHVLALALLEQQDTAWTKTAIFERAEELRLALEAAGAPVFDYDLEQAEAYAKAVDRLELLGMVRRDSTDELSVEASKVPLLQYYANSVAHYLESEHVEATAEEHGIESTQLEERDKKFLDIVYASYDRVQHRELDGKGFIERFYDIFLAASPQVKEKFSGTDMQRQQRHLAQSLEHMQDYFVSAKPSARLREIAAAHSQSRKDIPPEFYDLWLQSLVQSVSEYDPEFGTSVELAWRAIMAPGIAYMRSRYRSVEPAADAVTPAVDTAAGIAEQGIARWVDHWARRAPDRPALKSPARQLSYAELADESARLAAALRTRLGVETGDRVAFLGHNRVEFIVLVFACARLGAILVPINLRLAVEEQKRFLSRTEARALFVDRHFLPSMSPAECKLVALEDDDNNGADFDYRALLEGVEPLRENLGTMESPLFIVFTSGSTGDPKGAVLTQGATHWNALNSRLMHDMKRSDYIATTLPFFHVGGINIQTLPALQVGAKVSIFPAFDAAEFLDFIEREQPTLTVLVPAQMQLLMKLPDWFDSDMASIRAVSTGSTIVDRDLIRAWANKGVPVIQIYGCTESSPIAVHQTVEGIGPGLGSVGHPALYTEVRIADDDGNPVAAGREGEILLRGPNIMSHYWNDEAATKAAFHDGWLMTGDLGYRDQDGRLRIVGRKKRLIISGGENIHPAEIEQVLEQHPGIEEAAVIGVPDPKWDEVPAAVVAPANGAEINEATIREYLKQHLGRYKHPRYIVITDALPRTGLDKVAYPQVEELVTSSLSL